MLTKEDLRKPEHFALDFFKKSKLKRHVCSKCKVGFWSVAPKDTCGEPPCVNYGFLGSPIIPGKWDMDSMRKAFINFFEKNGHKAITRYPIVCRWKADTYFVGASIYDFMPWVINGTIEPPANPLVISQPSFRAQDLDNVGLGTARHMLIFEMMAHHAFNYTDKTIYWKDRTVELCWKWLTEELKIKPELITFKENSWEGGGNAGPCFEVLAAGNEVATLVFMEFIGPVNGGYTPMEVKVVDTGYGLERHLWAATGVPTIYDAVYPDIVRWLASKAGVPEPDPEVFYEFCQYAGNLNVEEANVDQMREIIAAKVGKKLDMEPSDVIKMLLPYHAIYQIADHTKSIMFILADGVVPSNVAEGYIPRLLIRRCLRNLVDIGLPELPLTSVIEKHMKSWPEFEKVKKDMFDIVDSESEKYSATLKRGADIVKRAVSEARKTGKKELDRETLIQLYDSHGLLPRDVKKFSELPLADISDIDTRIAVQKTTVTLPVEKAVVSVKGVPETKLLYHDNEKLYDFTAKVLRIIEKKWVVLDKTAFYPRGGGQEPDLGTLGDHKVYDVEKIGNVVVHAVENIRFKEGSTIKGNVNAARRQQIAKHHTATHIINGAARRLLGEHVWQAGSKKDVDKAHLDITHYAQLTDQQIEAIEKSANDVVKKKLKVLKQTLPRDEAERKFGFRLYQGGAVPGRMLHTIDISGWDVEACGGIHVNNTSEIGPIVILKTERVQDGIVRLIYAAGPAAEKHLKERADILDRCAKLLKVKEGELPEAVKKLFLEWKKAQKKYAESVEKTAEKKMNELKFMEAGKVRILVAEISGGNPMQLKEISRRMSGDDTVIVLFGTSDKVYVFASAGPSAVKAGVDVGAITKDACTELGGGGGGQPALAQGVGTKKEKLKFIIGDIKLRLMQGG